MGVKQFSTHQPDLLVDIQRLQALRRGDSPPQKPLLPDDEAYILQTLYSADMELQGLMPWSSNYTFLVSLTRDDDESVMLAVYKPCAGERPLWDFPDGNLCRREFATYLLSLVLGWPNVPPTVLREGPHGEGAVQYFIEAEFEAHYFNMRESVNFAPQFREIALFDYIVNNADRKGGHCLKDKHGQLWAIDHGLTFHSDFKLRTVIWDFCNDPIPPYLLADLSHLQTLLNGSVEFQEIMGRYISEKELQALVKRVEKLLSIKRFPDVHPGRNVPFPPV